MVALAEHHTGNPEPGNPKEKLSRKKLITAIGAGAVSVAAIFGVAHNMGNDEKSVPQENSATHDTPPPSVDTEGNTITIESSKTESKIATGETLTLLKEYSKVFDKDSRDVLNAMNSANVLSKEEASFLNDNFNSSSQKSDKSTYTDNEVLAATALNTAAASVQNDSAQGHAMLPLVISKDAKYFVQTDSMLDIDKVIVNVFSQVGPELKHPSKEFLGQDLNNSKDARVIVQSKILGINGRTEVLTEVGVYVLNSDGDGNEEWQVKERYDLNYNGLQTALDTLRS